MGTYGWHSANSVNAGVQDLPNVRLLTWFLQQQAYVLLERNR